MQYIRKLLFSDLDKSSIEHVLRQLRKLRWSECEAYLLKCFMKVHRGKYGQIHLIASLTAGLSRYHDDFSVAVVDEVCPFQCTNVCHLHYFPHIQAYDLRTYFQLRYIVLTAAIFKRKKRKTNLAKMRKGESCMLQFLKWQVYY